MRAVSAGTQESPEVLNMNRVIEEGEEVLKRVRQLYDLIGCQEQLPLAGAAKGKDLEPDPRLNGHFTARMEDIMDLYAETKGVIQAVSMELQALRDKII